MPVAESRSKGNGRLKCAHESEGRRRMRMRCRLSRRSSVMHNKMVFSIRVEPRN